VINIVFSMFEQQRFVLYEMALYRDTHNLILKYRVLTIEINSFLYHLNMPIKLSIMLFFIFIDC